jgi:mRNA-degrading endonuclease RelE of RelBE toxin-antitoxin system
MIEMFTVLLHPLAAKFLEKADTSVSGPIRKKLSELREFPERGKHLKYTSFWSLRIGDYRAIYEIKAGKSDEKGDGGKVIVLFIGHRKDVYDDLSKLQ